jgi:beta-glucanase (GH16 family)
MVVLFVEAIEPRVLYAAAAAALPAVPPPPLAGNWNLVFDEEFNGTSLGSPWTPHQYWSNGPTQGEGLEESDPANVAVSDGALQLTVRIDNAFGPAYTGGLVQTGGVATDPSVATFGFLYGYAEASIQVPAGAGFWPAFWMLPVSHHDDDGEIDVMEMYDTDPTTVFGTVHRFGDHEQHRDSAGTDLSAGWHTFAVDWEPDHITWFLDGAAFGTTTNSRLIPTTPMFPILDLAVGGENNAPTAGTPFPGVMSVNSVRIWQQAAQAAPALIGAPVINGDDPDGLYGARGQPAPGVQRSVVEDVVYTFNQPVAIPDANTAFTVAGTGPHAGTGWSTWPTSSSSARQ